MARRARMNGFIDDLREQWAQVVNDGEIAIANLREAEAELLRTQEIAMRDPVDAEEWQTQYDRIVGIRETVDSLSSAVATIRGWLNSATSWIPGLSGMAAQGLSSAAVKRGNLGVVPVVAGLTVAGMIALVTKVSLIAAGAAAFVTYLLTKNNKQDFQQEQTQFYVEQGLTPEAAAEQARRDVTAQAQQETGYQFVSGINKLFLYGGIAAIAFTMLPHILGARK